MTGDDLDAVVAIEQEVHAHPWTRGNFADALQAGYLCRVLQEEGEIIGYVVLMMGVDEAELLDIGVAAARQRRGWGRKLLQEALTLARQQGKQRMVLEVRASNASAIGLYRDAGFVQIGLRRGYYPAANGREDAVLMGCEW